MLHFADNVIDYNPSAFRIAGNTDMIGVTGKEPRQLLLRKEVLDHAGYRTIGKFPHLEAGLRFEGGLEDTAGLISPATRRRPG